MDTTDKIRETLSNMTELLIEKNIRYGNSALNPPNIFSKLPSEDSICIRLDDKLNRIKSSDQLRKNDVSDMIGYLTLLCVSRGWTDFQELID